jgi:hypothetical protein
VEKGCKKLIRDAATRPFHLLQRVEICRRFLQPTQWRISKKMEPMPHFICGEQYFAIGTFRPSHSVKTIALIGLLHNLRPLPLREALGFWATARNKTQKAALSLQHTPSRVYL